MLHCYPLDVYTHRLHTHAGRTDMDLSQPQKRPRIRPLYDPKMMGNEPLMAVHTTLLFITSVCGDVFAFSALKYEIFTIIGTVVFLLMAYIMDQVNGP